MPAAIQQSQAKQKEPAWYGNGFYGDASHLYVQFNDGIVSLGGGGWNIFPDFDAPYVFQHAQNIHVDYDVLSRPESNIEQSLAALPLARHVRRHYRR